MKMTKTLTNLKEARAIGILGYVGKLKKEVILLEAIRKAFNIVPLSLKEQRKKNKEWVDYKKTQDQRQEPQGVKK
jgi:hypothetical protein